MISLPGVAELWRSVLGSPAAVNKDGSITVDGRKRTYFVHLPPRYDHRTPTPVVLVLHGAGGSPEGVERVSGMSEKADKENFIAVYPRGTGQTWNSGKCCGDALLNDIDDVAFFRKLIEKLERDYAVDPKRIFVTGFSNGGMMAYRLACELSDKIAAAAPVEGAQNLNCHPSNPVSIIVFHGTSDRLVPFKGGTSPFHTPDAEAVDFWVEHNGCSTTPKRETTPALQIDTYTGCKDGTEVELYAIKRGRHAWPGSRMSGNSVAATDLMWAFFSRHLKQ